MAGLVRGRAGTGLRLGAGRLDHRQSVQGRGRAKKSTAAAEALGRSRGGLSPKGPAVVDALGNGRRLVLTPSHEADGAQRPGLLAALPAAPGAVVADRAYDPNAVLAAVAACGAAPVIPSKTTRKHPRRHHRTLYADRHKAERFFGPLKEARSFATRYEKTATSFWALAQLLAALDWMR